MSSYQFDDVFGQGTRLLHEGKAAEATVLLQQAHSLQPDHVDATINLSGAYILSGKFKKAVTLLEPLSEREPDNVMVWTNLGAAYLGNPVLARDQEQQRAIEAFKRALSIRPAAPSVAYNIGLIYRDRGETAKAINWFRQAIRDDPADRHARQMLDKLSADE
jgi:tetratricopeptide (TPR) repeat protein